MQITRTTTVLASLLATAAVAPAADAATHAKVVRVVNAQTVRVHTGAGTKTIALRGVIAPVGSECFARQATSRLRRLLPPGARVTLDGAGRAKFVVRGGKLVNQQLVAGGFAVWNGKGSSARDRKLSAAMDAAQRAGRGAWSACVEQDGAATPAPAQDQQPAQEQQPAQQRGMSEADFRAFMENHTFTRASSSSNFGGSTNQNTFTFCSGGIYAFQSESFNNGFESHFSEAGHYRITNVIRHEADHATEAALEFVTEQSSDSDFDPNSSAQSRTFTNSIVVLDDGRVRIGGEVAQRGDANCG